MELSTNIPAANVIPAKLMTLKFRPNAHSIINVPIMLIGMAKPTTRVLLPVRRNKYKMEIANILPTIKFCWTRVRDRFMYVVSS